MDHNFVAGQLDQTKCVKCRRTEEDHSDNAQCEACPKRGKCNIYCGMLLCETCLEAEKVANEAATAANNSPDKIEQRVIQSKAISLIAEANRNDESLNLRQEIFNAKTAAIVDITRAIDADDAIVNKAYAKAEFGVNRHRTLQDLIFKAKQAIVDAENEQKAWTVYLNQLANQLRAEERAKLRLEDINYPAESPKKTPKPKTDGAKKASKSVKVDMAEINMWAAKIGMPYNVIHMRMLQLNMTAEVAARTLGELLGKPIKD